MLFTKKENEHVHCGIIRDFIDKLIIKFIKYDGELAFIINGYFDKKDLESFEYTMERNGKDIKDMKVSITDR